MAAEAAPEVHGENHDEHVVILRLADEFYAIDTQHIQEIVRMQRITSIPGTAGDVAGLTTFRGSTIPVIDLRQRCGVATSDYTSDTRIVVVSAGDGIVGLTVDAVAEVRRIPAEQIKASSSMFKEGESVSIRGTAKLEDRLIALIELAGLLPAAAASEADDPAVLNEAA